MKYLIKYYNIPYGADYFSVPEFTNEEIVEADSKKELETYIATKKDMCGFPFKKKNSLGYTHISNRGGLKVSKYIPPKIKRI